MVDGTVTASVSVIKTGSRAVEPRQLPPWAEHLLAVCVYALLTAVMTWPLVQRFGSAVLGPPGDNLEYVWKLWWFKRALVDLSLRAGEWTSPLMNPWVYYPYGYPLALSETTMANTVLGLPLTALLGEVATYNTLMFSSFVLSGYGLFVLLRALGRGIGASLFGGAAFAYCPYRLAHLGAGHLPLMGTAWIALLFWSLEKLVEAPSWRRGVPVGLFGALMALSSWYYAMMVSPFALLYLLLRTRPWRSALASRRIWVGMAVAILVAGILVAPAAIPMAKMYARGEARYDYSLAYVDQWSASPVDFFYPNAMHSLWGAELTQRYYQNINENLLYLSWVAIVVAACGLWHFRRSKPTRAWAIVGAVAFVLALGTTLHYAGEPVYLTVPPALERAFSWVMHVLTGRLALNKTSMGTLQRDGAIPVPLPTLLLYLFVPFAQAVRVWSRFGLITMLSVAVLSGMGYDALRARFRQGGQGSRSTWLGAVLWALLLLDLAVFPYPYGYTEARAQPVDDWLSRRAVESPVIHFPLEKTWYGTMLYPQSVHGQPLAYGYGTFMPEEYREASRALSGWPDQESLDQLRRWGVRYALVGARSYGPEWAETQHRLGMLLGVEPVAELQDRSLYHGDRLLHLVRPSPDVPSTELVNGDHRPFLEDEIHVYDISGER